MISDHSVIVYCQFGDGPDEPVGSGIEIKPGVILTAKHVLDRPDLEAVSRIQIGWWRSDDTIIKKEANLNVWKESDQDHDVAIITCDNRPDDVSLPGFSLASTSPAATTQLHGFGYPCVSDVGGVPYMTSLQSPCSSPIPSGKTQLTNLGIQSSNAWEVGKNASEIDRALAGASGAGLFDGDVLTAIFLRKNPGTSVVEALLISGLRDNSPEFRAKLQELSERTPFDEEVEAALDRLSHPTRNNLAAEVENSLCPTSLNQALRKILRLLTGVQEDAETEQLQTLARCLVVQYLSRLEVSPPDGSSELVVPTGKASGAEGFRAVLECRPPEFDIRGRNDPHGKKALNQPPAASFSSDVNDDLDEIAGRLTLDLERFKVATQSKLNRQLDYVFGEDSNRGYRLMAINSALKEDHSDYKFYFVYDKEYSDLAQIRESISNDYGELVPVVLKDTDDPQVIYLENPLRNLGKILNFNGGTNSR